MPDQNVGKADATLRVVLGVALFVVAAWFNATPAVSLLAALGGLVMVGTALTRKCPLYLLLGLDTCPRGRPR